jgi:hypothetical protein
MEYRSILSEAADIVGNSRQDDYGDPTEDFNRISTIWSTLLENKLQTELTPGDVAVMMIALKLSRAAFKHKRDNWVDIAGYAQCGDMCTNKQYE